MQSICKRLVAGVQHILYKDSYVSKHKKQEEERTLRGLALIAALALAVMSVLNIKQHSNLMLVTTSVSAALFMIGYFISRFHQKTSFLRAVFYAIFVLLFTAYTIEGGNDGFAALWLVTGIYAVMLAVDFKAGFLIGAYYMLMLSLVFLGPLSFLLQYDYNETFMLRFPFLFGINFAFATYIVVAVRNYQYQFLIQQQELEHISTTDLSTGLMNRNSFIKCEQNFSPEGLHSLAAVFIDVNGLHEMNNRAGHEAGDRMLCAVARLSEQLFPQADVYRLGGDEFLILCKNAAQDEVCSAATRLDEAVKQEGYSISYGVEIQYTDFNLDELVKRADAAMIAYKAAYYANSRQREREGASSGAERGKRA